MVTPNAFLRVERAGEKVHSEASKVTPIASKGFKTARDLQIERRRQKEASEHLPKPELPHEEMPVAPAPARLAVASKGSYVSWVVMVLMPALVAGLYLFGVAKDQYASHLGFSVQKEEAAPAIDLLGGITDLAGAASNDTDILFEYILSENMVRAVGEVIDLQSAFRVPGDPVFSLGSDGRIEALHGYWGRMVDVFYDRSAKLIEIRVKAFDPATAQAIAVAIQSESERMINALSQAAREDATRHAAFELSASVERLKEARTALTAFRTQTQIVDPIADIQGRMGLLNTLQAQLAEALIDLDLIRQSSARDDDPRVVQGQRRVEVIENRISEERLRFSESGGFDQQTAYSELIGEFEAMSVDQEFAEEAYIAALANYNLALSDAQRQSRYLATYLEPTLAETPLYPQRLMLLSLITGGLFAFWSVAVLSVLSFRDRL